LFFILFEFLFSFCSFWNNGEIWMCFFLVTNFLINRMLAPLQYSAIFEIILNLKIFQLQICYVSFNKIICIVVLVFLLLSSFFSLCFYLYILCIVFMHLCILCIMFMHVWLFKCFRNNFQWFWSFNFWESWFFWF
jgi:hypothetical protein